MHMLLQTPGEVGEKGEMQRHSYDVLLFEMLMLKTASLTSCTVLWLFIPRQHCRGAVTPALLNAGFILELLLTNCWCYTWFENLTLSDLLRCDNTVFCYYYLYYLWPVIKMWLNIHFPNPHCPRNQYCNLLMTGTILKHLNTSEIKQNWTELKLVHLISMNRHCIYIWMQNL